MDIKEIPFKGNLGQVLALDTKQVTETGEFEGYASTYGNVDKGGDIVKAGCFDESLRKRPANKVKMLWQHNTDRPIGVWTQFSSDSKGLYARGKLLLNTVDGKNAYEFLTAGAVDGLSIGFRTQDYEYDTENYVRTIIKADLMEVSVVTFPMNEDATVSAVKAADKIKTIREFENFLRDSGFSIAEAKRIASAGFKSLGPRDEGGALAGLLETLKVVRTDFSS